MNYPIFRDIWNKGSCFEIQSNLDDDTNFELFDDDEDFDEESKIQFKNPWKHKFDELKGRMHKVSEHIYKKVEKQGVGNQTVSEIASVTIQYNAYLESEDDPFDSTYLRDEPECHIIGDGRITLGLSKALQTMKTDEQAWFW